MIRRLVLGATWGVLLLSHLPACSSADAAADMVGSPAPTNSSAPRDVSGPSVEFVESDVQFLPGDTRPVTAKVTPPGVYDVKFSLSGDFGDAFLDESQVQSGEDGIASVTLNAPSSAATFTVRASVGTHTATLPVSAGVSFADLVVVPRYAGHRVVESWTATVRTGSNCRTLPGIPASDGPLVAESAPTEHPVVKGVPVGVPLTVTVRAGHFAGGCTDMDGAAAGSAKSSVEVAVLDRPLQMGDVSLRVELDIDRTADSVAAWNAIANELAQSFVDRGASDAGALLDSMIDAIPANQPDSRTAFKSARTAGGWDAILVHSLHDGYGAGGLHELVSTWISTALQTLSSSALTATLTSRAGAGFGMFELSQFGGFDPSEIGLSMLGSSTSSVAVTWTAATGDQVLFGGTPKWPLSRLAGSLALGPAQESIKGASTVPQALSSALPCTDVGALLAPGGTNGIAYPGCDAGCVTRLCQGALGLMWTRAAYTPEDPTLVDFAATASATISDDAHPSSFVGAWVGSVRVGDKVTKLSGAATGKQ